MHVCVHACVYLCMWGESEGQNESTDSQNFGAPTLCLHEKECKTGAVVKKTKQNPLQKAETLNNCTLLLPDQTAESDTFLILKAQSGCHLLGAFQEETTALTPQTVG